MFLRAKKEAHDAITVMLTTTQAAEYLGLAKPTLEAWRVRGGGPAFCKMGKAIRYRRIDLDAFIVARIKTNTAQGAE